MLNQKELKELSKETGWSIEDLKSGYQIFLSDYMNGALHIERLDCVNYFDSDKLASEQAEKDGIKIIHDLPIDESDDDFAHYIDTKENREIIKNHLMNRKIA